VCVCVYVSRSLLAASASSSAPPEPKWYMYVCCVCMCVFVCVCVCVCLCVSVCMYTRTHTHTHTHTHTQVHGAPDFVLVRMASGSEGRTLDDDSFADELTHQLSLALRVKLAAHVVSISAARTHVVLELLTPSKGSQEPLSTPPRDLVVEAIADLKAQMHDEHSQVRGQSLTRHIRAIHLQEDGAWLPAYAATAGWGGLGGGVGASVCVSSGMSDFAPERALLSTYLLPSLQMLMREGGSDLNVIDLRYAAAEQCDGHGRIGIRASLHALSASALPLVGGRVSLPLVLTLLGHQPSNSLSLVT